jgi:putative phage-type endonuclease
MNYPCGKIYADVVQGSPEWDLLRCGSVGGSSISDVMSKGKNGGESTGFANLRAKIVCERLSGCKAESFSNAFMDRGTAEEPLARECYEYVTGNTVEQVGLILHPTIPGAHCSPDGLVQSDSMIEIKRKIPALHIAYLLKNQVPSEYVKQIQWGMACSGRLSCEFVSYSPELPTEMQLFVCRMDRDDALIAEMETAVIAFNESVEKMISALKALRP